ncbi:MAG: hypothetical protein R3B83_08965 [Nitrospirales bacterium]
MGILDSSYAGKERVYYPKEQYQALLSKPLDSLITGTTSRKKKH